MILTLSTAAMSLTSITLFLAILRAIYKSSSSFILRQYLSRAIDASPALLFHPYCPPPTPTSQNTSTFTHLPSTPIDYSTSRPYPFDHATSLTPPSYIFTPSFGLRTLLASRCAAKEGKLNELWMGWLRESGSRTVEVRMLGCRIVLTDEGGNVEEVMRGGKGEWGDGGEGWFGRTVLGWGGEGKMKREDGVGSGSVEDLKFGDDMAGSIDEIVESIVGSRGAVGLEELCESMAKPTKREESSCRPSYRNGEKVTVGYDVVASSLSEDEKSIKSEGAFRDTSPTESVLHHLKHTLSLLARHPAALSRLHTHLASPYSTTNPQEMTYLSAILHEARRLYPSNPVYLRQAQKDTYLPHSSDPDHPLLVPRGAYVACLVGSLNRRTELFGLDAEVFKPERWTDGSCRSGRGFGLEENSQEMEVVESVLAEFVKRWDIEGTRGRQGS